MRKKELGTALGCWIALVIPATIWILWGWKIALVWVVVSQFLLMLAQLIIKSKK